MLARRQPQEPQEILRDSPQELDYFWPDGRQCVEEFFGVFRSSYPSNTNHIEAPLTFLDLPANIRLKIYTLAGLVRYCPIPIKGGKRDPISNDARQGRRLWQRKGGFWQRKGPLACPVASAANTLDNLRPLSPSETLDRCRCSRIPLELLRVSRLIYQETFGVLYGRGAFAIYTPRFPMPHCLERLSKKALSSITTLQVEITGLIEDDTLSIRRRTSLESVEELFRRIASDFNLTKLHFSLHCHVVGLDAKNLQALVQMLSSIRGLRHCAIRLDRELHMTRYLGPVYPDFLEDEKRLMLDRLARTMQSTPNQDSSAFPFFKLPPELRAMILQHTDLVVRYTDRPWLDGFNIMDTGSKRRNTECCGTCTLAPFPCYCSRFIRASSTSCTCDRFPESILRVSKAMYAEARRIHLAYNRFTLCSRSLSTMISLLARPQEHLSGSIRDIRLRCLELNEPLLWKDKTSPLVLANLVATVKARYHLSELNLSIECFFGSGLDFDFPAPNAERRQAVCKALFKQLEELKGLKSFKVFLPPASFSQSPNSDDEERLEKQVMGEDYDAKRYGKLTLDERIPNMPFLRKDQVPVSHRKFIAYESLL